MKISSRKLFTVLRTWLILFIVGMLVAPTGMLVGSVEAANRQKAQGFNVPKEKKFKNDSLRIKLKNADTFSLDGQNNFTSKKDSARKKQADRLNDKLRGKGKRNIKRLVDSNSSNNSQASRKLSASVDDYYTIKIAPTDDIEAVAAELAAMEGVEAVYPESLPAPAPAMGDYTNMQKYLNSAPEGIGADFAKNFPGGKGRGVRIIDLEYSWNNMHEDLSRTLWTYVRNGTPVDPFNDNNHGTAVMGELIATDNGFGVTGLVNDISLSRVNTYNQERGWDIVGALQTAANIAKPGDVILIEQQTWAPGSVGGFAPVEWEPAIYDAIKALTDSGVNVVQAAGNSGHNLDDSRYFGSSFPMGKAHSGSIIVGAGSACDSSNARSRLYFSNYGKRVEMQGHGECVVTTGYGWLDNSGPNSMYTASFSGTSSAAPMVAAAVASLTSAYRTLNNGRVLTPAEVRFVLILSGTPQNTGQGTLSGNIGPLPNLSRALPVADRVAPEAPENIRVELQNGKPRITWDASRDNSVIKEYHVFRNGWWVPATVTGQEFVDNSAVTGSTYKYRVRAVDVAGHKSVDTERVTITVR